MKLYLEVGICFLSYLLFGMIIVLSTSKIGNLFFVWNVFLAFLPLLFARMLGRYMSRDRRKTGVVILLAALWLLFFPNAPYMVTDLIYFGNTAYFVSGGYTTSVLAWAKLVYIGFGVLFGVLLGLRSMYEVHLILLRHKGRRPAYAAILASSLLSGFAIYIGRILRFNSWDVLRPLRMLAKIKAEVSAFTVVFSLFFAAFTLGSYALYYALVCHAPDKAGE
ncbi:MAG: DUF1361 domain-containing protein [Clostridiales bacterium]|jgi:uncharacterized membrane protein|nr:DUF1361 domain-containing protein [Clostridiales bacterium]